MIVLFSCQVGMEDAQAIRQEGTHIPGAADTSAPISVVPVGTGRVRMGGRVTGTTVPCGWHVSQRGHLLVEALGDLGP